MTGISVLYEEPDIDVKIADIIREFPASKL